MRHKEFQKKRRENARWVETDWVFTSDTGSALYPSNVLSRFKRFCSDNGLRYIRIHDLRHTMAQLALAKGIRIEGVSETLGHTRIDTTKTIYAANVMQLALDTPHQLADALMEIQSGLGEQFTLDQKRWAKDERDFK